MSAVRRVIFSLCLASGILALPAVGSAQVRVTVAVPAPMFEFQVGAPLVYVSPGVWVLPESEDEVFYNGGWYWAYHGDHWYRSRGRTGGWVFIDNGRVPRPLMRMDRGRYRHWRAPEHARTMSPRGWERAHERKMIRQERHEDRRGRMAPPPGHWQQGRMGQPQGRPTMQQPGRPSMQQQGRPAPQQAPMQRGGGRRGGGERGGGDHGGGHGRGH